MKRLTLAALLVTLTLGSAWAKSYEVNLYQPAVVAGAELKAGTYRLTLDGTQMTLSNGINSVRCEVKVESVAGKHKRSSLRLEAENGKYRLVEIRLRGTDTRLMPAQPAGAAGGR
ncbi:MAG: hypothetical protein IT159_04010 [Bryobacterales bacterium]|nr:hypothetical protein [Bryobacterales bacterium]